MSDSNLKAAIVGATPQDEIKASEPATEIQSQPLAAADEFALARKMGLSPERYKAVTGRPYPVVQQPAKPAAPLGVASTQPAAATAKHGVVADKSLADLLKEELDRQPHIGPDEPISAFERAKLRASARALQASARSECSHELFGPQGKS